ncbi:hypothetical protein [Rhodococcus sp. 14-2470-1a]|uniref:hypothetical protein n=1 Tax=Rhodococcus sp. 14-2470-1a TaxID=2023150 RepID=UPI0015C645FB|nr:hypothetical protein [Rhodococcus sp. 14-2470-1a]
MTYDEQRRLLGLPDVRDKLNRERAARLVRWLGLGYRYRPAMQLDYALAGGKNA